MNHLKLGIMLLGLAVVVPAAHAAIDEESSLVSRLDLSTIKFEHSATDFLPPYKFSASVVLTRPADNESIGLQLVKASYLQATPEKKKESGAAAHSNWQPAAGSERVSLSRLLRLEFKGEQYKLTLRPDLASMERGRLNISLRPGSASILWKQALQ